MNRGNRISVIISKIWKLLIGSRKDFSQTNRTVSVVCVITTLFLIASFIDNLLLGLKEPLMINLICIGLLLVVYGMSRFRKAFKPALALYAMSCYVALAATYIYNGGIDGPALIMFFLTFHLLIALSPKQQHLLWASLHIVLGLSLITAGYLSEDFVKADYHSTAARYIDMGMSYAVSLFVVYIITGNLRRSYERERNIVKRRTQQVAARSEKINEQNERLREIAWMQSHGVRAHVATILGLAELIDSENPACTATREALQGIKTAAKQLDDVVRDINTKARNTDI